MNPIVGFLLFVYFDLLVAKMFGLIGISWWFLLPPLILWFVVFMVLHIYGILLGFGKYEYIKKEQK